MNLRSARKLFQRAPATHRPMARWLWNDRLDPDRLAAQLDRLLDLGLGGALIRPGQGLPPGTYLSDAWFEAMSAVVRRARKRRASIWIAEDFDDPFTQEIVRGITAAEPRLAAQMLRMTRARGGTTYSEVWRDEADETPEIRIKAGEPVGVFEVTRCSAAQLHRYGFDEPIDTKALAIDSYRELMPRIEVLEFRAERWPECLTGIRSDAVQTLLTETHQKYHSNLRRYLGNTLGVCMLLNSGIPSANDVVPWDAELPHLFSETHGYSIEENLPLLFFDLPGFERVRNDFWTMIGEMFDEGFATPFERWCDERKTPGALGIHNGSGFFTRIARGGSRMWSSAGFAYNVVSSRDNVRAHLSFDQHFSQAVIETREAASLRRQLDRGGGIFVRKPERIQAIDCLLENSTKLGLGVEFDERSMFSFSLRGARKTGSPPVIGGDSQRPARSSVENDCAARFAWVSDQCANSADLLLLQPLTSLAVSFRPPRPWNARDRDCPAHDALARHFSAITQALADAHIDFDFGDEQILARHAVVEHDMFRVGKARYRIIVLPPSVNLRASTLALLHDFAMGGGHLIGVGTIPELIDGRPSEQVKAFFQEYGNRIVQGIDFGDYRALIDRLVNLGARSVAALGEGGETRPAVYVRRGRWDSTEVITAVNGGWAEERATIEWIPEVSGVVELWDPTTGRTEPVATCKQGETARVLLDLARGATRLLVVTPGDPKQTIDTRPWVELGRLRPEWTGQRMQPNACALSACRAAGVGGEWSSIEKVREILASEIERTGGPVKFRVEWRVHVVSSPALATGWSVAFELGEDGSLWLDGHDVVAAEHETVFDPAIVLVRVPPLSGGEHTLEVSRTFAEPGDLQPPWLMGPFMVNKAGEGERLIEVSDDSVALGRWPENGLPSYFGEVVYRAEVEGAVFEDDARVRLEVEWLGHAGEVRVNGKPVQTIFCAPYECDLTAHWGPGTKVIEIAVTDAPDNALAGLRMLDEFDTTHAGLIGAPEIAIYGRAGGGGV